MSLIFKKELFSTMVTVVLVSAMVGGLWPICFDKNRGNFKVLFGGQKPCQEATIFPLGLGTGNQIVKTILIQSCKNGVKCSMNGHWLVIS